MSNTSTENVILSSPPKPGLQTRTIAITSGHARVGKTNLVVNLAIGLAMKRSSVMVVGADGTPPSADVLLGLESPNSIHDIIQGKVRLAETLTDTDYGVQFLSANKGIEEISKAGNILIDQLESVEQQTDFVLVDTPSGIAENVMSILRAASEVVIVTVPEPNAVIDTYASVKVLHMQNPSKPIWIVVNNVVGLRDGEEIFKQLNTISMRFLSRPLEYLGSIPEDTILAKACGTKQPVIKYAPDVASSRSFRIIANTLFTANRSPSSSFWRSLVTSS